MNETRRWTLVVRLDYTRLLYWWQRPRVLHTRDSHLTSILPAFWSSFTFVTHHINIDEQVSTTEWVGDQIPGQVYDDSPPCMGSQPTLTPPYNTPPPHLLSFSLCRAAVCLSEFYSIWNDRVTNNLWHNDLRFEVTFLLHYIDSVQLYSNNWMQFGLNLLILWFISRSLVRKLNKKQLDGEGISLKIV